MKTEQTLGEISVALQSSHLTVNALEVAVAHPVVNASSQVNPSNESPGQPDCWYER